MDTAPRDRASFAASPTSAYRADVGARAGAFGADDDRVLAAAVELHAAANARGKSRREHLLEALAIAIDLLGDERIDRYVEREWRGDRCYVEALVVLASVAETATAHNLAAQILDDLLRAADDLSALERGRLLAFRAKLEWKLGRLDDAKDRYLYLASLGEADATGEIAARAEIGLMSLAQQRGNMPEVREHGRRAVDLGQQHDLPDQERLAHQGLAMAEAKAGRYDAASHAAWRVVQLSAGDETHEAEGLQILGQIFLEAGSPRLARACFAAVTTKLAPARVILPALGGLALASAREGDEATVEWVMREISHAGRATPPSYQLAEALLECGTALAQLERPADAAEFLGGAREIAEANGYHELSFRLDNPETVAPRGEEVATSDQLAKDVAALEPERLPTHVRYATAPA